MAQSRRNGITRGWVAFEVPESATLAAVLVEAEIFGSDVLIADLSVAEVDALALWDDSGNGLITCAEARAHGIAPVRRGHPAYQHMIDRDDDGIVCE